MTTFTVEVESDYIRMGDSRRPTPSHRLNGNRTGKLRVRVYPRVGSGMGRNFRRGSGTGTGSIIGYGYGSGS